MSKELAEDTGSLIKTYIFNKKESYEKSENPQGRDLRADEVDAMLKSIADEREAILLRRKEIDGVGILYMDYAKFAYLLDEAFKTYQLGLFNSTIAICGTVAERICYDLVDMMEILVFINRVDQSTKELLYEMPFRHLLEFLWKVTAFNENDKNLLHKIYDTRNRYVHPKKAGNAQSDALTTLNQTCRVLENMFSVFRFYELKDGKLIAKPEYRNLINLDLPESQQKQ